MISERDTTSSQKETIAEERAAYIPATMLKASLPVAMQKAPIPDASSAAEAAAMVVELSAFDDDNHAAAAS